MTTQTKPAYFSPSVTVDVVMFTIEEERLKILLIKRKNTPFRGHYALPGGFIKKGETAADTAKRVLANKAGVKSVYMEQLFTFDSLARDPRGQVISISYFALVPRQEIRIDVENAAEQPEFISIYALPELAFDHAEIIAYAMKRLGDKIRYTNIIYSLLPEYFTLTQLQKTYETILNKTFDKRNFRKKILELGLVKASKKKQDGTRQRPATLYSFVDSQKKELERFFGDK